MLRYRDPPVYDGAQIPAQGPFEDHVPESQGTSPSASHPAIDDISISPKSAHLPPSESPTRLHSPLRKSSTCDELPELESPTRSLRSAIASANRQFGRSKMSFTGDRRTSRDSSRRSPIWMRNHDSQVSVSETQTSSPHVTPTKDESVELGRESITPKTASAGSSRFAFFNSARSSLTNKVSSPEMARQNDELMHLDLHNALFPPGTPRDTFSPAAFKNLEMNATGLVKKFQTAYQQRTNEVSELRLESMNQSNERDEAQIRVHHLKMQLEDMARKAAEHESIMQSLMEELTLEKKMRLDERQSRQTGTSISECSVISEDLDAEHDQQRRMWRTSDATAKSIMSDTDEESIADASVFSRSRSPTVASVVTEIAPSETPTLRVKIPAPMVVNPIRPPPPTQLNTFQKLFKGISGDSEAPTVSNCINCRGQSESVAWDTVSLLKDENKGLKTRVGELESAIDGVLDAVNGIPL